MSIEQRLADWLDATTPEPPRLIGADDIGEPLDEPGPLSHRLRALAAAGIALAVVATAVVVVVRAGQHDGTRHAGRGNAAPAAPRSATTAAPGTPQLLSGWVRSVLPTSSLRADSLASEGSYLIGIQDDPQGGGSILVRIDPRSGKVIAGADLAGDTILSRPLLAAGRAWLAIGRSGAPAARVLSFAAGTMALRSDQPVRFGGQVDSVALAASGATVFAGAGATVFAVDARTGRPGRSYRIPGRTIDTLAVHADRLYAGTRKSGRAALAVLDVASGARLATVTLDGGGVYELRTAGAGVWVGVGFGNGDNVRFHPYRDLSHSVLAAEAGGGPPVSVDVYGRTTWLGGPHDLACADADTGNVLAHSGPPAGAGVFGIVVTGATVVATLFVPAENEILLVRLRPPAACTR